jgi:hypothetical protein
LLVIFLRVQPMCFFFFFFFFLEPSTWTLVNNLLGNSFRITPARRRLDREDRRSIVATIKTKGNKRWFIADLSTVCVYVCVCVCVPAHVWCSREWVPAWMFSQLEHDKVTEHTRTCLSDTLSSLSRQIKRTRALCGSCRTGR